MIHGVAYGGKSAEFERFLDMPAHSALPLELALSGRIPADRLKAHGWQLRDALEISYDPWVYRDYLAWSWGEWSVVKNAYVASRSGWFSCRTAKYLTLGVPAVVQDTGFSRVIPSREGLLAFQTPEETTAAIEDLRSAPERHSRAACAIAKEYFDSRAILDHLLGNVLAETR